MICKIFPKLKNIKIKKIKGDFRGIKKFKKINKFETVKIPIIGNKIPDFIFNKESGTLRFLKYRNSIINIKDLPVKKRRK